MSISKYGIPDNKMKLSSILLSLLLLLSSACTTRFIADFEADTAGSLPDPMPDGSPDDQIFVLDFGSGDISVSNSDPITGTKSLRLTGPATDDDIGNKVAFMYAEEISSNDKRLYASWAGRSTSGASTIVRFWSGHFQTLVEIEFEQGNIKVFDNTIGTYTANQVHSVFVNVDPTTDMYQVSVIGGVSSGSDTSGSIPDSGALPTGNIGLSFNLYGGGSADSYVLDTVRMSERKP